MKNYLFARMNADDSVLDEFHDWYNNEHMAQASAIPGFGEHHRRYESFAVSGKHWDYYPNPRFTGIYEIRSGADLEASINSDEYKDWSGDFLVKWQDRTKDEVSVLTEQIFGDEAAVEHATVLLVQMNVYPQVEEEFNDWYNNDHIPQASEIPGFGSAHRRFRSIELEGKYWHYRPKPMYTAIYAIKDGADVKAAIDSEEYREWSGDFLKRWRDRTFGEVSTMCKRIY